MWFWAKSWRDFGLPAGIGCPDREAENKVVDVINYTGTNDVNTQQLKAEHS